MALESERLRNLITQRFALGGNAWESSIAPTQPYVPPNPTVFQAPPMQATPRLLNMPALPPGSQAMQGPGIPMGSGITAPPPPQGTLPPPPRQSAMMPWLRAQGAGGGPGAMASGARALQAVPSMASAAGGNLGGARAASAAAGFVPDNRAGAAMARGVRPMLPFNPAGGVRAAASQTFARPTIRGGVGNALKISLPIHLARGATDSAFKEDSIADRFAEGAATGGEIGGIFGLPGAAVGALGVGLGDAIGTALPWNKGKKSVSEMLGGLLGQTDESAQSAPKAVTFDSLTPVLDVAGISDEGRAALQQEWAMNEEIYKAADMWDDDAKLELQQTMLAKIQPMMEQEQAQQRMLQNQIAMQGLVSEYFGGEGGIIERMRQSGQARGDAMMALSGQLPGHLQPAANFMAQDARTSSNSLAAAYEAQVRLMPTYNAMTQYQQEIQGIASQYHNQAVQGIMGNGGATDPLSDPSAMMAQELMGQMQMGV